MNIDSLNNIYIIAICSFVLFKCDSNTFYEKNMNSTVDITVNNATRLRNFTSQLVQTIDKVEMCLENFRRLLNKQFSPKETINTITENINNLCVGKERAMVRIVK